ncbi:hypothetical protein Deipr_2423 (plasmid) [Deinococcus proteolyticus MRP]|uniref:Isoprenylcysteine carboxyl methyltransferase n=4 Tax=Deinococcus TaxID=1298 RepID=F0RQI3_DEIPM|nr:MULTISPECIES: isoprenylcysteine carboxylmethyltransferase family protein [Deinococcus]ADY27542.1 hypothetical protein Deipr_2423 [Deinococcus proteolyticus MRP]MCY1704367.1 isoprenylcysteine carboxylmethyltransferase family protein [Deinococcus sp. SL84]RTR26338.1 isoprenylcysteine carboxylmethyltransferase family protein [Deinococcus radiophilus]UFA52020.1 isoprenylcysteine carboxylmethyltransferase family protein [Deinococcus radiophilus]GHG12366.1 hypothetical protein GCM10017783_25580 [
MNSASLMLLAYMLLYFAVAFVWRSLQLWRTTGVNPMVLPFDDSAHGYVGRAMRFVLLGVLGVVLLFTFTPHLLAWLGPIVPLIRTELRLLGWGLLLASLVWIAVAQGAMGASWRIGIDRNNRTELIQRGPFALSRNPIFLGMRVNLLGLFLVLPNAATLAVFIAGEVLMQVQVRLEEAHLGSLHGAQYDTYRQQVRRWL